MSRKNFIGRALRSGLLATAAATLLMGNMAAFAAEDDEVPAGIFWQQDIISGTVTAVGTDSITVSVTGAMEEGGFAMGMPQDGMQPGQMEGGPAMGMPPEGETPPELPDGQTPPEPPEGETPPELPDGQTPPELPDGQTPPELPDGQTPPELPDGQTPPELPEGMGDMTGQPQGMGMPPMGIGASSEITVNIDESTAIITMDAENGTISDITEGSEVMVMLEGDLAVSILVLN